MSRRFVARMLALVAMLVAASAPAQNLIANSGFAADLGGWSPYGGAGTRTFASDDVNASPASGSAEFGVDTAATQVGLAQCIPVTAGVIYEYSARIKFPTGQTAGAARAMMEIGFHSSADCSAPILGAEGMGAGVGTAYALSDAVWPGIPGNASPTTEGAATAPTGAASALVRIFIEQISGSDAHRARFDEAVFHDASTVPVTLQSFDVE